MAKLPTLEIAGGSVLRGTLAVSFELSEPWTEASALAIDDVLRAFVSAGVRGAYPPPGTAAASSQLSRTGPSSVIGNTLSLPLAATSVDRRAFQLLRHMASRLETITAQVTRITVAAPGDAAPTRMPIVDDDNDGAYPGTADRHRFGVEWSDDADGKRRRVIIEFNAEIGTVEIDALKELMTSWEGLLERGAFTMPLGLPDILDNVGGPVNLFDAWSAEIEVTVFRSSEAAWDILLNLLEASPLGIVSVAFE